MWQVALSPPEGRACDSSATELGKHLPETTILLKELLALAAP